MDVRIVAASNRNLKEDAANGKFRSDLYYRLNVVHVYLPPLRERTDDLPLLVNHFLAKYAKENHQELIAISSGAMERILDYHWPGNVRELENVIERAIILSDRHEIQVKDLPPELREPRAAPATATEEKKIPDTGILPIPGLSAGDRMPDSGFKVRQMQAMEFIKTQRVYNQ